MRTKQITRWKYADGIIPSAWTFVFVVYFYIFCLYCLFILLRKRLNYKLTAQHNNNNKQL